MAVNRSAEPPTASAAQTPAAATPAVLSVSPASGASAGGTTVTITGTGFTGATAVRFGATPTPSFTVLSDTQITAATPLGTGTVQVTVTTPSGTSNQFVTFSYVATPAPVLSSVVPASGPSSGGTTVTLTGSGFTGVSAVRFGGVSASFVVNSATQITATAPAGSGTVQVTVVGPGGTSNGVPFTYTTASVPVLTSVTPSSGPAAGGTTVTLTGTGLASTSSVRFGTTAATSFTVVSDTHVTAVAPAGTGTVQVTVTTPGGTSNGVSYTYSVTPALSGVSPNQGPTSGGNTVTLTGTNLTGTTAVTFGTTPATSFTVLSPTQISAVVPASTAGPVDITVTTPGGSSTLQSAYFYVSTPVLTGVAPPSGPLSGGNTVTLTGVHLVEATAVRFGTIAATGFTVVSDSQITAVVPAGAAGPVDVTVTTAGGTSNGISYTYLAAPVVTTVVPNTGPTAGGITLTLTGTGFAQATQVLLGTAPAGFTIVSDNHIVVDALPGAAGPVAVTVTSPGGTSAPKTYTRVASPGI
ncbi:IPT/TIG domain-containing protein [Streptomyces sp. DSM 41527]|uniref:IPT/TIG domain-containing protein n=1 Tax=Streptomyces mooreae TaxID=3075523 RepID=A0ABU2T6M5_9ACTN|nr:IPT/TIG domain-containing protein [Streptomyces sp. DSM 41527]MDT0456451.1 IPT/TIG domain-containing protein [Streptomyces sp. DSM 41527]